MLAAGWGDGGTGGGELDPYQIFVPYRSYCARKTVTIFLCNFVCVGNTKGLFLDDPKYRWQGKGGLMS